VSGLLRRLSRLLGQSRIRLPRRPPERLGKEEPVRMPADGVAVDPSGPPESAAGPPGGNAPPTGGDTGPAGWNTAPRGGVPAPEG
jgi:hypothetical protein